MSRPEKRSLSRREFHRAAATAATLSVAAGWIPAAQERPGGVELAQEPDAVVARQ